MDLLRFTTAGSVDDGKSTLIGRLLYDSKSIFEDQYEAIERSSQLQGNGEINLALLTDGLRAEREQGITIDVAYRYFATPRRKFIIADTPGHIQYTRNMVTGASTAELAIVLVDARNGVLTQSRRHGFIASLLQIPHIVVAINKMDLVGYSQERYDEIVAEYESFAKKLVVDGITYIPISALMGDNVVNRSDEMAWYDGPTLMSFLENVRVGAEYNAVDFRFPVQHVIRPHQDFRGFAGQVASGSVVPGEDIIALPSGRESRIKSIVRHEGSVENASVGESVVIELEDEIDISRGDMIVRSRNRPTVDHHIDVDLCWMGEEPLRLDRAYILQHTTRRTNAYVSEIIYRFDVDTLHREEADTFQLNDIGRVELTATAPIFFDAYRVNRRTGAFILIDPDTNTTVAAGMIRGVAQDVPPVGKERREARISPNVVWTPLNVPRVQREARNGHRAAVLWFTGLSGSGKSAIARTVEERLFKDGCQTMLLDGDHLRHGLNGDLGFSANDRAENIRRVGEVSRLFFEQGSLTFCTFVSPYAADRDAVRSLIPEGSFAEIFVDCSIETCKRRDPKGLYVRALRGEITDFTGISAPYERPRNPELALNTDDLTLEEGVERVLDFMRERGLLKSGKV